MGMTCRVEQPLSRQVVGRPKAGCVCWRGAQRACDLRPVREGSLVWCYTLLGARSFGWATAAEGLGGVIRKETTTQYSRGRSERRGQTKGRSERWEESEGTRGRWGGREEGRSTGAHRSTGQKARWYCYGPPGSVLAVATLATGRRLVRPQAYHTTLDTGSGADQRSPAARANLAAPEHRHAIDSVEQQGRP